MTEDDRHDRARAASNPGTDTVSGATNVASPPEARQGDLALGRPKDRKLYFALAGTIALIAVLIVLWAL
jgi:hypothetical protein